MYRVTPRYDWHDDGTNSSDPEHRFGTVRYNYSATSNPVYEPKPSYLAAKTFAGKLNGYVYNKQIQSSSNVSTTDYILFFYKNLDTTYSCEDIVIVVWTTGSPHYVQIPSSDGNFSVTNYLGNETSVAIAYGGFLSIYVDDSPFYIVPLSPNPLLSLITSTTRFPLEIFGDVTTVTIPIEVYNPLNESIVFMPEDETTAQV